MAKYICSNRECRYTYDESENNRLSFKDWAKETVHCPECEKLIEKYFEENED